MSEELEEKVVSHEKLQVNVRYETREQLLTALCVMSFTSAFELKSGLPDALTDQNYLNGFTGRGFRHLLNNLCRLKDGVYLEIGTFCGSSLISSLYRNYSNLKKAYAIDDWSEFREYVDPKEKFNEHRAAYIPDWKEDKLNIIEADCFSMDLSKVDEKVDIYFYDGAHKYEDHKKAFTYFNDVFSDVFIAVVDDWEKKKVREATHDAFNELGYTILSSWIVVPPPDRKNKMSRPDINWWHGVAMFLIKK